MVLRWYPSGSLSRERAHNVGFFINSTITYVLYLVSILSYVFRFVTRNAIILAGIHRQHTMKKKENLRRTSSPHFVTKLISFQFLLFQPFLKLQSMLTKDNKRVWMKNALCLLCLQSSFVGIHSFLSAQNHSFNSRRIIHLPSATHTNISKGTILHSTKPTDKQKKMVKSDKARTKESKVSPRQRKKGRLPDVNRVDSGALFQREAMLQHDILQKETEIILSKQILKAKKLRDLMTVIIEDRKLHMSNDFDGVDEFGDVLLWGSDAPLSDEDDNDIGITMFSNPSERWQDSWEKFNFSGDQRISSTLVKDGSKLSLDSLDADINMLTDYDISEKLKVKGGRKELKRLIHLGAKARTTLMKSNIRLVVSISKKWIGKDYASSGKEGSIAVNLYNGGWDRPSLDEVVQEGVLGLARAVDKFDPSRGLRFSTYSTHWITSYVRQCFQTSATGCLKVPSQLHEIKV